MRTARRSSFPFYKRSVSGNEDRVSQNKSIVKYAARKVRSGDGGQTTTIRLGEETMNIEKLSVDFDYMENMGLRLKEGRFFNPGIASDRLESVVVMSLL